MIVTVYTPEGEKQRTAVGYAGGACNKATLPYEKREIKGSMKKVATGEACLPEEQSVAVTQSTRS